MLSLLLTLVACLDPEARPYEEYLADLESMGITEDSTPDSEGGDDSADAPRFDQLCSEDGGEAIELTLVSGVDAPADLYWVDSSCQTYNLALMTAAQELPQSTYVGHVFRLKDAFDTLDWVAEVRVQAGDSRVVLEGAP